jgi:hypothetical protein
MNQDPRGLKDPRLQRDIHEARLGNECVDHGRFLIRLIRFFVLTYILPYAFGEVPI